MPSPSFKKPLDAELFNGIALQAAKQIAQPQDRNRNKATQLRRFYDELVSWENRLTQFIGRLEGDEDARKSKAEKQFQEYLPFIRMLNAKAAYAEGRKLVDRNFVDLLSQTLKEVSSPETLTTCKHFWEAFMGFYKQERPGND